jgi:hypothetical protein
MIGIIGVIAIYGVLTSQTTTATLYMGAAVQGQYL